MPRKGLPFWFLSSLIYKSHQLSPWTGWLPSFFLVISPLGCKRPSILGRNLHFFPDRFPLFVSPICFPYFSLFVSPIFPYFSLFVSPIFPYFSLRFPYLFHTCSIVSHEKNTEKSPPTSPHGAPKRPPGPACAAGRQRRPAPCWARPHHPEKQGIGGKLFLDISPQKMVNN